MRPEEDPDRPGGDHSSAEHQSKEGRRDQRLSKCKSRDDDIGKSREDPKQKPAPCLGTKTCGDLGGASKYHENRDRIDRGDGPIA